MNFVHTVLSLLLRSLNFRKSSYNESLIDYDSDVGQGVSGRKVETFYQNE